MQKQKTRRAPPRQNPALDLFGEVPITLDDLRAWVAAVAGIPADSWRWAWYVDNWNVADKVRAAKLAGTFDAMTGRAADSMAYSGRLMGGYRQ